MNHAYLLTHAYELGGEEEIKILGIYSTLALAEAAKQRYFNLEGFCDHPRHCFYIERYSMDEDASWREGFFHMDDIKYQNFIKMTEQLNQWLGISKSAKDAWEDEAYYHFLTDLSWMLSSTDDVEEIAEHMQWQLERCCGISRPFDECMQKAEQILQFV